MIESIKMTVIKDDCENELEFEYEDESIKLKLDGKEICAFDYDGNFKEVTERMLETWGGINE